MIRKGSWGLLARSIIMRAGVDEKGAGKIAEPGSRVPSDSEGTCDRVLSFPQKNTVAWCCGQWARGKKELYVERMVTDYLLPSHGWQNRRGLRSGPMVEPPAVPYRRSSTIIALSDCEDVGGNFFPFPVRSGSSLGSPQMYSRNRYIPFPFMGK